MIMSVNLGPMRRKDMNRRVRKTRREARTPLTFWNMAEVGPDAQQLFLNLVSGETQRKERGAGQNA